jgi:hypothetical protein
MREMIDYFEMVSKMKFGDFSMSTDKLLYIDEKKNKFGIYIKSIQTL